MAEPERYELIETPTGIEIVGGGVVLQTRHSRAFIADLARVRPGLDLLDELLRSEHSPYLEARLRIALQEFTDLADWRVLDFGCGPGASSVVLGRLGLRRIVGLDLVNDYAQLWSRRLRESGYVGEATFVQSGAGMRFPFRAGSFDLVLLNGVLEHMLPEERQDLLRSILELVRPGGRVLVTETPNRWFPRNSHTKLWFSEWMPFGVAAALAHRFRIRDDFPQARGGANGALPHGHARNVGGTSGEHRRRPWPDGADSRGDGGARIHPAPQSAAA